MSPNTPEVVSRDREFAAIRTFLESEDADALILQGEAGIGKTTLWLAGRDLAREQGYDILQTRSTSAEARFSLAGLVDLLRGTPRESWLSLPEPQQTALSVVLAESDAGTDKIDSRILAVSFLNLLRALATKRPVLIAIDDLQWLDEETGATVIFALRRLGRAPVRLLATHRSRPGVALPLGFTHALSEQSLELVSVTPLSEGAIRLLLHRRLGLSLPRTLLHALCEAVHGNPLYALEFGRAGLECGEDGRLRLPGSLRALARKRIQALPKQTREALLYVAALADPTLSVLEHTGIRGELEPAFEAGVLESDGERVRFIHPLVAAATSSEAGNERRCEVHRALADVVGDIEQRAWHLAIATEPPDPKVAALLEQAAASAQGRGAPAAAAELLERARELTPERDQSTWARLSASAAAAHASAGHFQRLIELVDEAQTRLPAGPVRAAILAATCDLSPGLDGLFRQAASEAGDSALGVRILGGLTEQMVFAGRWRESVEAAEAGVALAQRIESREALGVALVFLGASKLTDSQPDGMQALAEALAIEQELGSLSTSVFHSPRIWQAAGLYWSGDYEEARSIVEAHFPVASERGDEMSSFQLMFLLVQIEYRAGRWEKTRKIALEALELAENLDFEYGRAIMIAALAAIEACEGELKKARTLSLESLRALAASGEKLWSTWALATQLFVELCEGNPVPAIARADEISARFPDGKECWWSYHQGDEIEALVLAGEHERARARIEALRRAGEELDLTRFLAWAERGEGLVRAARGDLAGARVALEAALEHHERSPIPLERARTLLAYGLVLRREKQRRSAREVLGEALSEFERLGARHFVGVVDAELKHVRGRPPARDGELTGAEDRVAHLVADGLANKQVAARLCVTESTVEATLTRVYAKLGISSRSQLARALTELSDGD